MQLLTVRNITKTFALESGIFRSKNGTITALDGVSLSLNAGSVLGVVGESGSGKTTLGKVVARLLSPDTGEVLLEGKRSDAYSRQEFAGMVQMVFQDPFASLNPKLTIGTMLFEAASFLPADTRAHAVRETLETVGLTGDIVRSYPHQFSGGQRQRIAIARALLRRPKLIIADEPLSALDISIQNQLLEVFVRLKETHSLSFIFISHDLTVTSNLADYLIVMKDGRIVEEGLTDTIISCPREDYTKKLLAAVPRMKN
jgi:ABC-type oligopeptide transport system ATPase subunit